MPARRMQAANEPAYHAVKLDVCLTTNEIIVPFRNLSPSREPVLVRPEEEVRIHRDLSFANVTFLFLDGV